MGAEQLGLNAQDIAVAAAEVKNGFNPSLLLNELAGDLRAQTGAGAGTVRHVDTVDAILLAKTGTGDFFRGINSARREDFNEGDKLAGSQLFAQLGFLGDRDFGQRLYRGLPVICNGDRGCLVLQRLKRANVTADFFDVFRSGATAAADDAYAGL